MAAAVPPPGQHIRVYRGSSILVGENGETRVFEEGPPSEAAAARLETVKTTLEGGYLEGLIAEARASRAAAPRLEEAEAAVIAGIVDSVTSEVGRGLVGLAVLQICIKAIVPDQCIRLHKASANANSFSWVEGMPMRVLDTNFITPVLRAEGLLKLNAYGFMMTRTLAENYPYSRLYKARIRGAREGWIELVERLETTAMDPEEALRYILAQLLNRSDRFGAAVAECEAALEAYLEQPRDLAAVTALVTGVYAEAEHSARLFEIAMHAALQVVAEAGALPGHLKPLTQMRSANKKAGNLGDIEVVTGPGALQILEAWDPKFEKPDLRDELEELHEKLAGHPETEIAGFVGHERPRIDAAMERRIAELEAVHGVTIELLAFRTWLARVVKRSGMAPDDFAVAWLRAFTGCLCQKRRQFAPIDEPSEGWVRFLTRRLREK